MEKMQFGIYRHYKGKEYEVTGFVRHSETLEKLVIYKALYDSKEFGDNALWVRPEKMFSEMVNMNGKEIPRFKYIGK